MKNEKNYNDLRDAIFLKLNSINIGEEFSIKDLIDSEVWENISDETKESIGKLFYAELLRTKNKSVSLNNNYVGVDYGIKNVYIKNNINTTSNSKKTPIKLIVGIVAIFVLVVIVAIIILLNSEPKLTHTEDNLDGLQGTWAKADKTTGIVDKSSYLSFDGQGNVTRYMSGYSLKYEYIFDDKVYYDDWTCSLKSSSYSDGSKQYRLECWSGTSSAIFIKQ